MIADDAALDGRALPLANAIDAADRSFTPSVICCISGCLACYFDEAAAPRRVLLLHLSASTPLEWPAGGQAALRFKI